MYSAYEYSIIFKFIRFLYPPQLNQRHSTSLGFAEPQLAPVSEESGAYEPQVGELLEGSCWLGRSFGKGERLLVHDGGPSCFCFDYTPQKERKVVFQASIFRCELLVSGRISSIFWSFLFIHRFKSFILDSLIPIPILIYYYLSLLFIQHV